MGLGSVLRGSAYGRGRDDLGQGDVPRWDVHVPSAGLDEDAVVVDDEELAEHVAVQQLLVGTETPADDDTDPRGQRSPGLVHTTAGGRELVMMRTWWILEPQPLIALGPAEDRP